MYRTLLLSAGLRAGECHQGFLKHNILLPYKTQENILEGIISGFPKVLRTFSYTSQKILLIPTILTALSLFPYLLWGTRNGTYCFSVYMLFLGTPWSYPDVLYIAGKTFSRGIQRSWNRGKRFSGDGVIRRTSLMNMAHRGE